MTECESTKVFIWSHPKSASTVLLRSFDARDDCHVQLEPFLIGACNNQAPRNSQEILKLLRNLFLNEKSERKEIIKEHAWVYEPLLKDELFAENFDQGHHILLIRDPACSLKSYVEEEGLAATLERQDELSLKPMTALLKQLQGYPHIVINADLLVSNPEQFAEKICEFLKWKNPSAMLKWANVEKENNIYTEPANQKWFKNVAKSTEFSREFLRGQIFVQDWSVPDELKPLLSLNKQCFAQITSSRATLVIK